VLYTAAAPTPALAAARHRAGLLLNNVATHVGARNCLYRAELRVKGALAARGVLEGHWWRASDSGSRTAAAAAAAPLPPDADARQRFLHWQVCTWAARDICARTQILQNPTNQAHPPRDRRATSNPS
jgi:hypothetical protein